MGVFDSIRERFTPAADPMVEVLQESIADLSKQLERDEAGWSPLGGHEGDEFSRDALLNAARNGRAMAVAHPLIRRALNLRQAYIHGQGVTITGPSAEDGGQDVDGFLHEVWDAPGNQSAFTGAQSRERLERALGTDGNVFLAAFTNPATGMVQVRTIPLDEITQIITNPNDRTEPWFYRREWEQTEILGQAGATVTQTGRMVAFYPALDYYPASRPKMLDGYPVEWGSPIYHVRVNDLDGWQYGIGDTYAAMAWGRAYRDFLADWATLVKSLSQFAWRATTKGSKAQQARQALSRRPANGPDGNPNGVGGTLVTSPDVSMEAIPKTGATVDSESGRPLAAMIAAGMDIPLTMLLADPGVTGARATAQTLDKPMRLSMEGRRNVWTEAYKAILSYSVRQAVKAPQGPLSGTVTRDRWSGREVVKLSGEDAEGVTIDVDYPTLDDMPLETIMQAIVHADGTGKVPPVEILRWILQAFDVENPAEILDKMTDDDGNWIDPSTSAGDVAVQQFRNGQDRASQQAAGDAEQATPEASDDDISKAATALGQLIRAGVEPEDAARRTGLNVNFTGAVPVSLRQPDDAADDLEEK